MSIIYKTIWTELDIENIPQVPNYFWINIVNCSIHVLIDFFLWKENIQCESFFGRSFKTYYKSTHFFFFGCSGGSKAARIASSNTFFRPFWVRAEHSTYFTARSSRASFSACSTVIGFWRFFASFSIVVASSRRSTCVPTRRNGVLGQWCVISGTHY